VERCRHQFGLKGAVDMVVTEFGVADLNGRSVRERAQAIIDVAHPEDRPALVQAAKARRILYRDQIFLPDSGRLYPAEVATSAAFKGGLTVRFRPIRPSDEEKMRRLFYRFSDEAVYYRYFTPVRTMPHGRMQAYVNVDWTQVMSIVGLVGPPGQGRIIAEARYIREPSRPRADLVFVVDPEYQGLGIASYLYRRLIELAREQGLKGFTAEVLFSNRSMMNVFREAGPPFEASLEHGIYYLSIPFGPGPAAAAGESAAAGPAEPAAPRPENAHAH
jgi:GNAT superfamily N-acetyltransferase